MTSETRSPPATPPSEPPDPGGSGGHGGTAKTLARNAVTNTLGIVAKALHPLFYVLITRVYGTDVFGVFLLANSFIELAISFTLSGFQDGVLLFASRHGDREAERPLIYRAMANSLVLVGALTALVIGVAWTVGPSLIEMRFPQPMLADAVQIMALGLPAFAIPQFVVAATKSLMIMKYDVIYIHTLRPLLLIVFALAIHPFDPSILGLAKAYVASNVVVLLFILRVFQKHFSVRDLRHAVRHLRWDRQLIGFAIPQNLNLTLAYFMSSIGTLFLGASGVEATKIAFFGTGAEIVKNLKQIRLVFSTAFSPVIARLYGAGRVDELEGHYAMVTRWVIWLVFPAAFAIVALRAPVLGLFHESYVTMDASFMVLLTVGAVLGCVLGFNSNLIAMTGHSRWNLYNAMASAVVSVALNAWLIPAFGLMGAAAATVLTTVFDMTIKLYECHHWLGVKLRLSPTWRPLAAGVAASAAYLAAGLLTPDDLTGAIVAPGVAFAALALGVVVAGVDPRDRARLRGLRRGKESP